MKASKFSEAQIAFVLKQADEGTAVCEVCRKGRDLGSDVLQLAQTLWRNDAVGGQEENAKLKRIVADLSLDKAMLQDVLAKNIWSAPFPQGSGLV